MTNERRIAGIRMALLLRAISFQLTSCSRTSAGAGEPTPPYVEVVTVEQRDILSKLGANDRTHGVAIAITLGMLHLELPSDDWTDGSESLGRTANA
jgi:predicted small secreted protein